MQRPDSDDAQHPFVGALPVTISSRLSPYGQDKKGWTSYMETHMKGAAMKDILILLAVVGVWVLLQAYILPKLGIST